MFDFFTNNCHSIQGYYKDLEQRETEKQNTVPIEISGNNFKRLQSQTIKIGSLIIDLTGMSSEEIQEAQALSQRFREIDNEIFGLGIELSLQYPDYYIDTSNTEASKNIREEKEVTLEKAKIAVQEYDGIRAQLATRLEDAKYKAYSESAIPQGIRIEVQKQLKDKKNQQEIDSQSEIQITPEPEEETQSLLSDDEIFNILKGNKRENKDEMYTFTKTPYEVSEIKDDEAPIIEDAQTSIVNTRPSTTLNMQIQDAVFEDIVEEENKETDADTINLSDSKVELNKAAEQEPSKTENINEYKTKQKPKIDTLNNGKFGKILHKAKVITKAIYIILKEAISHIVTMCKNKESESDKLYI